MTPEGLAVRMAERYGLRDARRRLDDRCTTLHYSGQYRHFWLFAGAVMILDLTLLELGRFKAYLTNPTNGD